MLLFLRLCITVGLAFLTGKLVSKIKLPSILGWLIAGMVLGPHALSLMNQQILDASWYQTAVHVLECAVGLMIGTELVWNKLKRSGRAIIITTLTQSVGTCWCLWCSESFFTSRAFRFISLSFSAELRLRRLRPRAFHRPGI